MTHFAPLIRLSPVALAIAMLAPLSANAQQNAPAQTGTGTGQAESAATSLERVEVTALKTRQSLQDVPASVTALTADDLARSGIVNSADLQQKVPGLSLSSGGRETNLSIRGVSNNVRSIGADPSNAVHLDGVYLPRSSMALTELFDLQRVEVLKGPEGTLYGRNATGGAINVVTRKPNANPSAEGFVGSGSLGLRRTQVAVGGGTDDVSGRLAVAYTKDDGYTRNLSTGTGLDDNNFKAFRGKLRVALGGKSDLTLLAQASEDKGTIGYGVSTDTAITGPLYPYSLGDADYRLTTADHRTNARRIRLDSPVTSSRKTSVMAATVNWDLGAVGFKSITGITSFKSGPERRRLDGCQAGNAGHHHRRQIYFSRVSALQPRRWSSGVDSRRLPVPRQGHRDAGLAAAWAHQLRRAGQLRLRTPDGQEQRSLRSGLWPNDLSLHIQVVRFAGCALQPRHQGWRCDQPAVWGELYW